MYRVHIKGQYRSILNLMCTWIGLYSEIFSYSLFFEAKIIVLIWHCLDILKFTILGMICVAALENNQCSKTVNINKLKSNNKYISLLTFD